MKDSCIGTVIEQLRDSGRGLRSLRVWGVHAPIVKAISPAKSFPTKPPNSFGLSGSEQTTLYILHDAYVLKRQTPKNSINFRSTLLTRPHRIPAWGLSWASSSYKSVRSKCCPLLSSTTLPEPSRLQKSCPIPFESKSRGCLQEPHVLTQNDPPNMC